MNDKIKQIAMHYGLFAQIWQTTEECAELIKALSKYNRATGQGHPTIEDVDTAIYNVVEEIADVEIMLSQLKYLFDCESAVEKVKIKKIERTLERMRSENDDK